MTINPKRIYKKGTHFVIGKPEPSDAVSAKPLQSYLEPSCNDFGSKHCSCNLTIKMRKQRHILIEWCIAIQFTVNVQSRNEHTHRDHFPDKMEKEYQGNFPQEHFKILVDMISGMWQTGNDQDKCTLKVSLMEGEEEQLFEKCRVTKHPFIDFEQKAGTRLYQKRMDPLENT